MARCFRHKPYTVEPVSVHTVRQGSSNASKLVHATDQKRREVKVEKRQRVKMHVCRIWS